MRFRFTLMLLSTFLFLSGNTPLFAQGGGIGNPLDTDDLTVVSPCGFTFDNLDGRLQVFTLSNPICR